MNATLEDKKKGAENIAGAVKKYGEDSPIPIVLHLDHGRDFDSCAAAIAGGYTSVMIDGSSLAFDENVELTREVVKYAHARGVSVEGELGVLAGVEDHVFSEGSTYTNPLKAVEFFRKTGVDALAISYGTMHGASKERNVKLRKEIAVAIRECLNHEGIFGALVSHGSSTVPAYIVDEINGLGGTLTGTYGIAVSELQEAARCGINKINVDTDIRLAVTRNMKEFFAGNPEKRNSSSIGAIYELLESKREQFDPRVFLTPIMDTVMTGVIPDEDTAAITDCIERGVKEVVGTLIVQFGSYGKAPWWNGFPWRRWLSAIRKCRFKKMQIESMRKVVEAMSANVLVVHGGGPTAVINASLYGVVEEAKSSGSIGRVYGAIGGSEGILKENFSGFDAVSGGKAESSASDAGHCNRLLTVCP